MNMIELLEQTDASDGNYEVVVDVDAGRTVEIKEIKVEYGQVILVVDPDFE